MLVKKLVFQLLMPGSTNPYQQFSINVHKNELVELGAHIQPEVIEQITRKSTDMEIQSLANSK
jgi:hypothetical protein